MGTRLAVDIESYSPVDLKKSGVYPYAAHEETEILLLGFAFDEDPVTVLDLSSGDQVSSELRRALFHPDVEKTAWNASFERTVLSAHFGEALAPEQWHCTMVRAMVAGLPASLDQCGKELGAAVQKMKGGTALINYFCKPCKPTKVNGQRTRNLPHHDLDKWLLFKTYNRDDVATERAIGELLP